MKKTVLLDFDGVLTEYDGHWGIPRTGAKEFPEKLAQDFTTIIYTTHPTHKTRD